ncbi:hypothetical protein HMPREF1505_1925 [Prevotella sp. ICM33]|uniref:stealth family protein n=1 Tax=Prevotella sp. ICM33 TaxID=1161412 RepID=UPI00044D88D5|nr:stealth family protein [Prevotella sp. ICM33]ETS95014.1 hypothetical protein HMPREF1505_1925 [Prevotella sp. ICM33]
MNIDFVIFWVDGSDIEWQKKKALYKGTPFQNADVRYRDWDILKFWFRAVEEYAPWVNHVYFVADNQKPEWLNWDNPKLSYVDHKDFIPHEFLPTFQANTIENNLHRISGLSEHFVVFNDDMFINAPITPEYYFKNGLPCDATLEYIFGGRGFISPDDWGISVMEYCNTQVVNAHFNRREVTKVNPKGWYGSYLGWKYRLQAYLILFFRRTEFQHFYTPHNEKAFLKSVYDEVWRVEKDALEKSCTRFREPMSINNYLFRYWQLVSNKFYPMEVLSKKKVMQIQPDTISMIERMITDSSIKSLCLNDSTYCTFEDYQILKPQIISFYQKKHPSKSEFEK